MMDLKNITKDVYEAQNVLNARNGEGSDFLGWVDLPENYDKEEFSRIFAR